MKMCELKTTRRKTADQAASINHNCKKAHQFAHTPLPVSLSSFKIPMRRFSRFILLLSVGVVIASAAEALSPAQEAFRKELANKVAGLEKKNATAVAGKDGWLFLTNELRFLAQGVFWGDAAAKVSRAKKREAADPIPAIVDFDRQLKARGIKLYVVPIPAKAAIYPDKI